MSGQNRLINNRAVGKSNSVLSANLLNANEVASEGKGKKEKKAKK